MTFEELTNNLFEPEYLQQIMAMEIGQRQYDLASTAVSASIDMMINDYGFEPHIVAAALQDCTEDLYLAIAEAGEEDD